jgi:hypothetical protein
VQASYSHSGSGFSLEMFTACDVFLQILKSWLAYFFLQPQLKLSEEIRTI